MQYEPDRSENEPNLLAYFCLFEDFQELRKTVRTAWTRYKNKEVELMSTAAMTQAAFELVSSIVANLSMGNILGSDSMEELVLHLSIPFLAKSRTTYGYTMAITRELSDWLCVDIFRLLMWEKQTTRAAFKSFIASDTSTSSTYSRDAIWEFLRELTWLLTSIAPSKTRSRNCG